MQLRYNSGQAICLSFFHSRHPISLLNLLGLVFHLARVSIGMVYEPLDGAVLVAWRLLLERFSDGSDLDRRLIDLLVITSSVSEGSPEMNPTIVQIVMELDDRLMYKGKGGKRPSVRSIQQLQKELDKKKIELGYIKQHGLVKKKKPSKEEKKEIEDQQQLINVLWGQFTVQQASVINQQASVINWLLGHVHKFRPDIQDKNGNYIGNCIADKLSHWINNKLRYLRSDMDEERRKEASDLILDKTDESGKSNLDKFFQNMEDRNQWVNEENAAIPFSEKFWQYLNEDCDRKLSGRKYNNGLNYHILAQRLYQYFMSIAEANQQKREQEKDQDGNDAKAPGKMADRVVISLIDRIAEEFKIKPSALRTEYSRNFRPYIASLWVDVAIKNEQDIDRLKEVIEKDKGGILKACCISITFPLCNAYDLAQKCLFDRGKNYKAPSDFEEIAKGFKSQGMKSRLAKPQRIFNFWQEKAKPAIGKLVIELGIFESIDL